MYQINPVLSIISPLPCQTLNVLNKTQFHADFKAAFSLIPALLHSVNEETVSEDLLCLYRVINAGKSALNEDQACCEVVELRKRPADPSSPSYTPTRRRSSLPSADILETIDSTVRSTSILGEGL